MKPGGGLQANTQIYETFFEKLPRGYYRYQGWVFDQQGQLPALNQLIGMMFDYEKEAQLPFWRNLHPAFLEAVLDIQAPVSDFSQVLNLSIQSGISLNTNLLGKLYRGTMGTSDEQFDEFISVLLSHREWFFNNQQPAVILAKVLFSGLVDWVMIGRFRKLISTDLLAGIGLLKEDTNTDRYYYEQETLRYLMQNTPIFQKMETTDVFSFEILERYGFNAALLLALGNKAWFLEVVAKKRNPLLKKIGYDLAEKQKGFSLLINEGLLDTIHKNDFIYLLNEFGKQGFNVFKTFFFNDHPDWFRRQLKKFDKFSWLQKLQKLALANTAGREDRQQNLRLFLEVGLFDNIDAETFHRLFLRQQDESFQDVVTLATLDRQWFERQVEKFGNPLVGLLLQDMPVAEEKLAALELLAREQLLGGIKSDELSALLEVIASVQQQSTGEPGEHLMAWLKAQSGKSDHLAAILQTHLEKTATLSESVERDALLQTARTDQPVADAVNALDESTREIRKPFELDASLQAFRAGEPVPDAVNALDESTREIRKPFELDASLQAFSTSQPIPEVNTSRTALSDMADMIASFPDNGERMAERQDALVNGNPPVQQWMLAY